MIRDKRWSLWIDTCHWVSELMAEASELYSVCVCVPVKTETDRSSCQQGQHGAAWYFHELRSSSFQRSDGKRLSAGVVVFGPCQLSALSARCGGRSCRVGSAVISITLKNPGKKGQSDTNSGWKFSATERAACKVPHLYVYFWPTEQKPEACKSVLNVLNLKLPPTQKSLTVVTPRAEMFSFWKVWLCEHWGVPTSLLCF